MLFGKMNFSKLVEIWNPEDQEPFREALTEELEKNSDDLPVDNLLQSGGWVEDYVEYTVDEVEEDGDSLHIQVSVSLTESIPSGCADMPHSEHRQGNLSITIDKETGRVDTEISPDSGGNLEYY